MVARLIKRSNYYICSNCYTKQDQSKMICWFCGHIFSNWETIQLEEFYNEENN